MADHRQEGFEDRGYRLVRELGRGSFGVVSLALDENDRAVVIKQLQRGTARTPQFRARFAREVDALRRLRHPHVMAILDADADAAVPYFVMPYMPGQPLSVARKLHPPPALLAVAIVRDVAAALAAVHEAGLVHRDVNPGNVLLSPGHGPVLFDFGLARAHQGATSLTAVGQILGTPTYMAPELFQGDEWGPPVDVYALGVTAVEVLLRHNPYHGPDAIECARRHLHMAPPRLDELAPHRVASPLARLVEGMLDPRPARRPSAREAYDDLRRLHIRMSASEHATEEHRLPGRARA